MHAARRGNLHWLTDHVFMFEQKLISNKFIEKVHILFYILVDYLSFKVGEPWRPGNSLRKH
jgi:hypothetical protein